MKRYRVFLFVATLCLSPVQLTLAQTSGEPASALPRLVRFGGTAKDLNGSPLTGVAGITFALYSEQTGGAPLWMETQNVTSDSNGHYTALLGSTKSEGLLLRSPHSKFQPFCLFKSEHVCLLTGPRTSTAKVSLPLQRFRRRAKPRPQSLD